MGVYTTGDVLGSPAFLALRKFLEDEMGRPAGSGSSFEEFEAKLHEQISRCEAEAVGRRLAEYDLDAAEIEVEGKRYRWKMRCEQDYTCQAGTVRVERNLYVPSQGEGKAVCPMEFRAGIVEEYWTPRAAKLMLGAVARTTPQEAEDFFRELGGMQPSRSSLDRLPKRFSATWEGSRPDFERELRQTETVPREAVAVAVSIDGVLAPMKGAGRAEKRSQEDKQPKGPAGHKEVGCGTVSFYDSFGERVGTIRYARMPEEKKEELKAELEAELASILQVRPWMKVSFLSDGAPDHWEFFKTLAKKLGIEDVRMALDIWHGLERVKKALDAYYGEWTPESKAAFEECRIVLREKKKGAEKVIRKLRYLRDRSRGKKRRRIAAQIQYLRKRKDLMRYAALLKENLPIGSGVVEAACKTLVTERMKRSGMSWREQGGQAILTLRSLIQSDRWERGWPLFAQRYRPNITPIPKRLKKTG